MSFTNAVDSVIWGIKITESRLTGFSYQKLQFSE